MKKDLAPRKKSHSQRDDAYCEAFRIDAVFNEALEKHPVEDGENGVFWRVFLRTVRSTLEIVEMLKQEGLTVEESVL